MEIGSLADIALAQMPALSTAKPSDISIAMLSKQLDMTQEMGADMIKAMCSAKYWRKYRCICIAFLRKIATIP